MKKENKFSCLFGHCIISNGLYQAIRNNIVPKKTTELVLLFHTNMTRLVFHWPNMSQKCFKLLIVIKFLNYWQGAEDILLPIQSNVLL